MTDNVTGKNQEASRDTEQARPEGGSRNVIAHGVECRIAFDKYINGRTAIVLPPAMAALIVAGGTLVGLSGSLVSLGRSRV